MSEASVDEFRPSDLMDMEVEDAFASLLRHAVTVKASDLFFHSHEKAVAVAIRRLGSVEQLAMISRERGRHMVSFVKAMAGMDIAEHRRPMDGRWIHEVAERRIDCRINCIPTIFGLDLAIRFWDHRRGLLGLDELGLSRGELNKLQAMLSRPSGLILVTGPTGTGKTTSLYACLKSLTNGARKINTLEDPVEFAIEGVRQSTVNPKIGLDFAELLRNVLRQSPDIIMVGEIRDQATAATAVLAANSGHLVLATLHSPVASGAVQTMLALGAHAYFLSSCLLGIIAQRLVRTLCPKCRVFYDISEAPQTFEEIRPLLAPGEGKFIYGPGGCQECFGMGYAGRTGIFEVMTMNQELRRLVAQARPGEELQAGAIRAGMVELRRSALLKVAQGITSTEEILRDIPAEYLGLED